MQPSVEPEQRIGIAMPLENRTVSSVEELPPHVLRQVLGFDPETVR